MSKMKKMEIEKIGMLGKEKAQIEELIAETSMLYNKKMMNIKGIMKNFKGTIVQQDKMDKAFEFMNKMHPKTDFEPDDVPLDENDSMISGEKTHEKEFTTAYKKNNTTNNNNRQSNKTLTSTKQNLNKSHGSRKDIQKLRENRILIEEMKDDFVRMATTFQVPNDNSTHNDPNLFYRSSKYKAFLEKMERKRTLKQRVIDLRTKLMEAKEEKEAIKKKKEFFNYVEGEFKIDDKKNRIKQKEALEKLLKEQKAIIVNKENNLISNVTVMSK